MMALESIKNSSFGTLWIIAVFFLSGFVTNVLEIVLFVFVRPLSKQLFRIIFVKLLNACLCVVTFSGTWWSQLKVKFYCDEKTIEKIGKEHAILIGNHRGDLDWLLGWILADRFNILGGVKCFVKHKIKYVPIVGWSWWFGEYGFIKRNWEADKKHFMGTLERLKDYPRPFWMGLYPEGTRMSPEKFKANQEYALANGFEPYRHHLNPRTKGFSRTVEAWKGVVPAVYDFTVIFEDESKCNFTSLLKGEPITAHFCVKRYSLDSIPSETSEETSNWCKERFREKDDLIDFFLNNKAFPGKSIELHGSRKTLIIVIFWSVILAAILAYGIRFIMLHGSIVWYGVCLIIVAAVFILKRTLMDLSDSKKASSYGSRSPQQPPSATSKRD